MSPAPAGPAAAFLEAAFAIGARLCRDAIRHEGRCNWLGDAMEPHFGEWRVVHRSFGPDLYSGTAGIALFLGRLARYAGDEVIAETARGALRHVLARRSRLPAEIRHSLYSGWLGMALVLHELAEPLGEPALAEEGLRMAEAIRGAPLPPLSYDILGGAAGAITGLLALYRRAPRDFLLAEAARLAGELCRAANRHADCWSWTTLAPSGPLPDPDLTGYSHGTAGIALALQELHALDGNAAWREAAELALAYERRHFDVRRGNWPDFRGAGGRPEAAGTACGMAWCHGAPGIGLARLRGFRLGGDFRQRAEAEAAIAATYAALANPAPGESFSLCHGLAGNAELFLLAAEALGEPWYREVAAGVGRRGLENYGHGRPWPCGVNGGGETPGLLLGLAGIGHFYLRLYDPAGVPSVLLVT